MKVTFAAGRYVYFGQQARKLLLQGIQNVSAPTAVTLGPSGRNVLLSSELNVKLSKDGVSVAKSVFHVNLLKQLDRAPEQGASLLKRAAHQTNLLAGDGTTTTALLVRALLESLFQ